MKLGLTKILAAIFVVGLFSQVSLADRASAQKTVAGIVASMSHFPSDDQKAELMAIAGDESAGRGMQMIAEAVGNIAHAANAEGKEAMSQIIASDGAPDEIKALAGVVMGFNHMASAEDKELLAGL